MSDRQIMETIYGKRNKYEVIKKAGGLLTTPSFWIFRNGERHKGAYSSLASAVEAAQNLANRE